jgi:hypothetical protein
MMPRMLALQATPSFDRPRSFFDHASIISTERFAIMLFLQFVV